MEDPIHTLSAHPESTGTNSIAAKRKTRRSYKCRGCEKVFGRSEHCIRHERVHTQERPFSCQYCHKKYARKDLLKRHERTLHVERNQLTKSPHHERAPSSDSGDSVTIAVEPVLPHTDAASHDFRPSIPASKPLPRTQIDEDSLPQSSYPPQSKAQHKSDTSHVFFPANKGPDIIANVLPDGVSIAALQQQGTPPPMAQQHSPIRRTSMTAEQYLSPTEAISFQAIDMLNSNISQEGGISVFSTAFDSLPPNSHDSDRASKRQRRVDGTENAPMQDLGPPDFDSFDFLDSFTFMPNVPFDPTDTFSFQNMSHDSERSPSGKSITDLNHEGNGVINTDQIGDLCDITAKTGPSPHTSSHRQSRRLFEQLPRVLREKTVDLPRLHVDDAIYEYICTDVGNRLRQEGKKDALPKMGEIQRFLTSYVDCFHRHFPIIHLPSFSLSETPSPLVLSMCSIGALYRLDRRRAMTLYHLANQTLLTTLEFHKANAVGTPGPLWAVQTRLILSIFAVFSGNHEIVSSALENMGYFSIEYRLRRIALSAQTENDAQMTWPEWILRESSKRLLCGLFVISNLLLVTYDVNPGFVITKDLMLETPDEERLWNARTEEQWHELRQSRLAMARKTIREVMVDMISGQPVDDSPGEPYSVSGFTALVIMHAVNVHMWHLIQVIHSISRSPFGPLPNESLRTMLLSTASSAIARCQEAITQGRSEDQAFSWEDPEGPLLFNCQAMLRIASSRLLTNTGAFDRLTLLTGDAKKTQSAIASYVAAKQDRSPFFTKAVAKAYEGFLTPVKIGHLLVSKTAAFSWSVEHAVAGWDSALFLTKWVYAVEIEKSTKPPTAEELHILEQLKALLGEMETEYDGTGSLAAAVAKSWASFLNDVWVWGITPQMGAILIQLSLAYDEGFQARKEGG